MIAKNILLSLALAISSATAGIIPWSQNEFETSVEGCRGFANLVESELVDGFKVKAFEYVPVHLGGWNLDGAFNVGNYNKYKYYQSGYSKSAKAYSSTDGITQLSFDMSTMNSLIATTDIYGLTIDMSNVVLEYTGFFKVSKSGIYFFDVPQVDKGFMLYIGATAAGISCCGDVSTGSGDYVMGAAAVDDDTPVYVTGARYFDEGYYPIKIVTLNNIGTFKLSMNVYNPDSNISNIGSYIKNLPDSLDKCFDNTIVASAATDIVIAHTDGHVPVIKTTSNTVSIFMTYGTTTVSAFWWSDYETTATLKTTKSHAAFAGKQKYWFLSVTAPYPTSTTTFGYSGETTSTTKYTTTDTIHSTYVDENTTVRTSTILKPYWVVATATPTA